jgi:hypothetical protein
MKLELDENAINFIMQVLGDLPTKTGAWEIIKVISEQTKEVAE